MRSLPGNLVTVIALAIMTIAGGAMEPSSRAARASLGATALAPVGDEARLIAAGAEDLRAGGSARTPADSPADPGQDTKDALGPEQEAPGTIPSCDLNALDAPRSRRVDHRATPAEARASRSVLPVVQPPRG
jgi:hypothetical protein